MPQDNPFIAGAYVGEGEPDAAVNIGVSGPGVVASALRRRIQLGGRLTLGDLAETLAAIIADEAAIGVMNDKTTGVRLIPVPGAKTGDRVEFGGLFGSATVIEVRSPGASGAFVRLGGRIPAPIQSLKN